MKEFNLNQLKSYLGKNPKPKDFDNYWKNRVEMLDQVDVGYRIEPAFDCEFENMEVYDLWFNSFDGALIYAKYLKPTTLEKVGLVLQFHGYPGASRPFFEQASFVDGNLAIVAMDCRGQGGKSEDKGGIKGTTVSGHIIAGIDDDLDNMLYVKIYSDIYLLSKLVTRLDGIDDNCIYANGASQGGGLATVCAALNPNVKKAAILYPFLSDFERVFDLGYDVIAYEGLRYYSRWFDPQDKRRQEIFERLSYIDVSNFAPMIQADVLFGMSLADTVCPLSTQYAVCNNIIANKKLYRYQGKGHETIHDFDDRIIKFFNGHDLQNEDDLIIFFQDDLAVQNHYLRRFEALGYNVLDVFVNRENFEVECKNVARLCDKYKQDYANAKIVFVGDSYGATCAISCASKTLSVDGLCIQSPLFNKEYKLMAKAKKITCKTMLGNGGLDEISKAFDNLKFVDNFAGSIDHLYYPKYGHERINDLEDQKMLFINALK